MIAVIQRVSEASVTVHHQKIAAIGKGLLVLIGIEDLDNFEDIKWLSKKIVNLRVFNDKNSVMNTSLTEIGGELLVVSQFTLHASIRKGNRPGYVKAAKPDKAIPLYESFLNQLEKDLGKTVQKGQFGADMKVSLLNDGPVTIIIDTKNKK
ncbi:MAG: D-tyrosyl-tRNA(Tyr) deacylase [Flavobacteriaceae bacterium]|nr:MAG: D-tyrosyl-tRNA(Tyr) deacylase [Flavobacteriaceae bacterium]